MKGAVALISLVVLSAYLVRADDTFIMKPLSGKTGNDVALMLIQGTECPPAGYKPLLTKIQETFGGKLWVGVPQFIDNVPEPVQFGSKVDSVVAELKQAGMSDDAKIVYLAHSLGGVMSQIHLAGDKPAADALMLYGSTILRKYRNSPLQLPVFTVDGDLDGLLRVTRQAEAYYHQVVKDTSGKFPVVLLRGLSHWSISSGTPPSNVKNNDLVPEVTEEEGHTMLATTFSNFITSKFSTDKEAAAQASSAIVSAVHATSEVVDPLLEGFHMEGYHHLQVACNSDFPSNPTCHYPKYPNKCLIPGTYPKPPNPPLPSDCICGSPWVRDIAHKMMGALDESPAAAWNAKLSSNDAFHDVSAVAPFHLPHTWSPRPGQTCKTAGMSNCVLNVTTVTMPIYNSLDGLDTGLYPVAATEFRTKMKSRSALWGSAGVDASAINFKALDQDNLDTCSQINAASYKWAMGKASPTARARFEKNGQPYVFVKDIYEHIGITGPKWIKSPLKFTVSNDSKTVEVASPTFSTADKDLGNVTFLDPVGFHYCKLLSPAAALEWIYVDGLKHFGGLKNQMATPSPVRASACPDLASIGAGLTDFDPSKGVGVWYENAYEDISQVGSSCQVVTNNEADEDGTFDQVMAVKYGPLPFKITCTYEATSQKDLFNKYAHGAKKLLDLPTVILYAEEDKTGKYAYQVEYTCKSIVGEGVNELRISSRSKTMDDATLNRLKQKALDAGVPAATVNKLKTNDYSKC